MAQDPVDLYAQIYRRSQRQQDTQQRAFEVGSPLERAMAEERDNQIRLGIIAAPSPDAVARTTRVARQAGEAPALVEPSIDDIEKAQRADRFGKVAGQYPAVGQWAARNPRGAVAASDDHKALGILGTAWDTLKRTYDPVLAFAKAVDAFDRQDVGSWTNSAAAPIMAVTASIMGDEDARASLPSPKRAGQAFASGIPTIGRWATGPVAWAADIAGVTPDKNGFLTADKFLADTSKAWMPKGGSWLERQVLGGISNAPGTIASLAGGVTLRSAGFTQAEAAIASVLPPSFQQGSESYFTARNQGVDKATATLYGLLDTAAEAGGEYLSSKEFIKSTDAGENIVKRWIKSQIPDLLGEEATTVAENATAWVFLPENKDKTLGELAAQMPESMAATAIQTLVGGGLANVTISGIEKALSAMAEQRRQEVGDKIMPDLRRAWAALSDRQVMALLEKAATESKLRTRDPDEYAALMAHLGDVSGVSSVFVPAEAVKAYQQSDSYDQYEDPFSDYQAQIDEAAATGGDVVLPVDFAFGKLPGTAAWAAVKDDMRLRPGGMSAKEAEDFNNRLEDIVSELSDQRAQIEQGQANERDARQALVERVTAELQNAGFTPTNSAAQAELIAARAATRAARLGRNMQPGDFDTRIVAVMPPALAQMQQADRVDLVINAMRKGKDATTQGGKSLLEWIAARGGINDTGGDIASMGGDKWHRGKVGRKKLIRPFDAQAAMGGVSGAGDYGIDSTMRAAVEAGYFPEHAGTDVQALDTSAMLDAIARELGGEPRHAEAAQVDDVRLAADELRQMLGDRGLDPDGMTDAEVRRAVQQMAMDGPASGTAYDQAMPLSETVARWQRQLEIFQRGEMKSGEQLQVGSVSGPFRALGFKGVLRIHAGKLRKIVEKHDALPDEAIETLPALLADPYAIIPGQANDGRALVVMGATTNQGDPLVASVEPDQNGRGDNLLITFFAMDTDGAGRITRAFERAMKANTKVYVREGFTGASSAQKAVEAFLVNSPMTTTSPGKAARLVVDAAKVGKSYDQSYGEGPRGRIILPTNGWGTGPATIELFQSRNPSTLLHELSHQWLEELRHDASLPDAPEQLKADWQTVQDWFSANGHAIGDDGTIPVEAHELWARGGERYLMEGKSPSSALSRLFETFRSWLVAVYRVVDALRSPITPEIREVFDRLLATEDEIAQARESQAMQPLFKDPAAIGMTGDEYAAYTAQVDGARDKANADLLAKTMAAIKRRETKRYNDERKGVWADEADRLDNEPILKSLRLMKDTPISLEWLRDRMGQDVTDLLPKRVPPIWREGGANPDALAEMAGFDSGQQMVEVLIGAERSHREQREGGDQRTLRARMIDQAADAEMTRRYGGDPFADGSIEREAIAAVNNELAGELLATEIRALSRRTGQRPTPYKIARQWARERVRQGVVAEEASPGAIQRHQRAVAKAGREAEEAMLKGDMAAALAAKQRQMLSSALLAEAKAAHDDVASAQERLAKIAKRATMKSVDQDYLDQAHALLDAVDLGPRSQKSIARQGKWEQWAAAREAEGYDVVVPASFEATIGRTHWSRLSVENLLGLDEAVNQVMHLGRLKQTLLDNQEQREWDEVFDEAVASAGNIDGPPPADLAEPGWWDALKGKALGADAALLKMETVFDWLDGGNPNGVFNRIVFRPVAEAQAREQDMLKDYMARIKAHFEAVPGDTLARWNDVLTPPFIDVHTGRQMRVNRQQVVAMALNIGNEGNLQRLADGYRVSPAAIEQYLVDTLTAEEWSFVQGVWDTIDTLWPQIEGLEKRVNGVAPEKIAPRSFDTPHGPMRGGYYPAVYDSSRDYKAEENRGRESDLLSGGYTRATTRASATKERAEKVNRPILLDLGVINRHLGEVIHDITHRESVIRANRFLTSERVMRAVDEALGPEIRKQFRPWIKFVANSWAMERAGNEAWGKIITKLRANVTAVGMGFRASTMLMQIAGYSNSTEVVGEAAMAKAIAQSTAHPVETFRFVMERSDEVRHRMDTLDRDIRVAIAQMGGAGPTAKAWFRLTGFQKFMFHGIGYMDRVVSVPTWLAAYNKALEVGMSERDAAYAGDKAVRQSQGAGGAKDLAAVVRGDGQYGKLIQLFTFFYSLFSAQYQRQRTLARDIGGADQRKTRSFHKLFARAFWLMIVPTVLNELLRMGMGSGGPDDDEWWAAWLTKKLLSNSLASLPLVRDVFEPLWDGVTGHAKYGYTLSPMQRIGESAVAVAQDAGKIVQGEDTTRATRNAMEAAGYFTGLVPGQIAAATQFLVDWANGDADPQDFGDWLEGLSTGKIKD